eukprot:4407933-Pleurochrysis_carterae.AAC.1
MGGVRGKPARSCDSRCVELRSITARCCLSVHRASGRRLHCALGHADWKRAADLCLFAVP